MTIPDPAPPELALHEEILLLALRDKDGTPHKGAWCPHALAGALLAELTLRGRLRVVREGKRQLVQLVDTGKTGEPVLDEVLAKVRASKKRKAPRDWVGLIASLRRLFHRVAENLCRHGILRADERRVAWFFHRTVYPEVDGAPEAALRARLQRAIFEDATQVDSRTAALVAVAHQTGVLKAAFDKQQLAGRKARIERIVHGNLSGDATKEAVEMAQAAAFLTVMAPTVFSH